MAASNSDVNHARVFVGADRSQLLAVRVLEHSIRRHTDMQVSVRSMHDLDLQDPADIRQGKRTGFSFTRFAIPELAGGEGRALYLDADMLVFRDIREVYGLAFDGAKVLIQEELPEVAGAKSRGPAPRRIKQCSVMLLDCGALDWQAEAIIRGLDGRYSYEDLMFHLCILEPSEIGYQIPFRWNSLETFEPGITGLIHYTDMNTQPWVHVGNPNGYLWLNEVRLMLANGALARAEVEGEVALGYFRPSLLVELDRGLEDRQLGASERHRLERIDADAGFQPHREVMEQRRQRQAAIKSYEGGLAARAGANAEASSSPAPADWSRRVVGAIRRRLMR